MFDPARDRDWLADIAACPVCLEPGILKRREEQAGLSYHQCARCRRIYPVGPFGIADFQATDKLLALPEPFLGLWAVAQDASVEEYRQRSPSSVALGERDVVRAFRRFMALDDKDVLDIGAGTDYLPGYVDGQKIRHYVALDPFSVERPVSYARVQGWAECLPFTGNSFDAVIMGTSLDHVICTESALSETSRVLCDGGVAYIWGAWWPDDRFYKNVPEKKLFPRPFVDAIDEETAFAKTTANKKAYSARLQEALSHRDRYASRLVDRWHFRHIPLVYMKSANAYNLRIDAFELWKVEFHENSAYLNGFLRLRKARSSDPALEESLFRHFDTLILLGRAEDRLQSQDDRLRLLEYTMNMEAAQRKALEARVAALELTIRARLKRRLVEMALRKFHGQALALTCVYVAPLRRKYSRRQRAAGTPLRICHVTCSFDLGGTQRQIRRLCESNPDPTIVHETIEAFPEFNYLYRRDVRLSAADYAGRSLLTRPLGRLVMNIGHRSRQLIQIYKFARDFGRLKPDVVVGWGHEIAMLVFAAAAFARVPRVVFCIRTWNPDFGWTPIPRLLFRAHRNMIPWTDAIIVNSSLLQADYAQWMGISPSRIDICTNGIELVPNDPDADARSRREVRQRLNIPAGAFVLSNVGRFSREKGQLLLLRAYERLIRESGRGDIFAVLCGDGPLLGEARVFAEHRGLAQALFPGRVEDVRSYLSASDVFVMPSDFEGMPNAMMEAMAMGLPCVSTNRSGALDIARDRREALFVDVGDEAGLADRLLELVRSPDERRRLGENARLRMAEFTVDKMIARFNRIVADAARRRP